MLLTDAQAETQESRIDECHSDLAEWARLPRNQSRRGWCRYRLRSVIQWASSLILCMQGVASAAELHPKLVVVLVVDQYSADVFNGYRALYGRGLKTLSNGVVFPNAYQGHAATETCPGHSTILTGCRPAKTGIIANEWRMPELPSSVYCVQSEGTELVSAQLLRVPTLGDRMKSADNRSKVVAIAGKDRAAVMLGGRNADLTLWWTRKGFSTYVAQQDRISPSIKRLNERALTSTTQGSASAATSHQCKERGRQLAVGASFIGELKSTADYDSWRASPALDRVTLEATLETIKTLNLGRRGATDLLAVSFSATDYVGHRFGTAGVEMCEQQFELDEIIGELLKALDRTEVSYVAVLTADHGGLDVTERNRERGAIEAQRVSQQLSPKNISDSVRSEVQVSGEIVMGQYFTPDVYLSSSIPREKYADVLASVVKAYKAQDQVEKVFTREEVLAAPEPAGPVDEWTLLERAKASFDRQRSGDVVVFLKPYVTMLGPPDEDKNYVASHGSPWGYDRRVPIMFWWRNIAGFEQAKAVETVDIMPTIAKMIGLQVAPGELDGRCLDLLPGSDSTCD